MVYVCILEFNQPHPMGVAVVLFSKAANRGRMKILDQEIVSEFYEKLRHQARQRDHYTEPIDVFSLQHVLVLAAWDVDSVCACKILQYLFKSDNIAYTLIPVSDIRDLQKALIDHSGQVRRSILYVFEFIIIIIY